jgi:hypothetical protein
MVLILLLNFKYYNNQIIVFEFNKKAILISKGYDLLRQLYKVSIGIFPWSQCFNQTFLNEPRVLTFKIFVYQRT